MKRSDIIIQQIAMWVEELGSAVFHPEDTEALVAAGVYEAPEALLGISDWFDCPSSGTGKGIAIDIEKILRQSAHLGDEDFQDYINVLEWRANMAVAEPELDVYRFLADQAPGSLELLNHIELRALDEKLTA